MLRPLRNIKLSRRLFTTRLRTTVIIIGLVLAAASVFYTLMVTGELRRSARSP